MELKPGYKQTEVGVIPEDWLAIPIGTLGTFSKGQGVRKNEANSGDIPCVRYGEIYTHHNDVIHKFNSWISLTVASSSKRLKSGDLLFAGSGETKEEIGKCIAFVGDEKAYAGGDIVIFSPTKGDSIFFGYLFNAPIVARQKSSKGQGDAVVHINSKALSSIIIPLPPTGIEQRTIATALSDVDALIDGLNRLIAKKCDLKQAALQQLLTGETRLPGFAGDWETKRADDIGQFRGGSGFPTIFQGKASGTYPFFKVSDMNNDGNESFMVTANNHINEPVRKQIGSSVFPAQTIVFAKVGAAVFLERKRILIKPSCIDNNMAGYISDATRVDVRFIHYVLLRKRLGKLVSTTALPSLSGSVLAAIKFFLPPLDEQKAIATVLSDMDAEITALKQRRNKTKDIKQAMMQELLTGKTRLVTPAPQEQYTENT